MEIDDGILETEAREKEDARKRLKKERLSEERKTHYDSDFWIADDDFTEKLLSAYKGGIGISHLSEETGLSRTALYRYLRGTSYPSETIKQRILRVIEAESEDMGSFWDEV